MTPGYEAALAPFFAAARAAPPEPPVRLLSAILADAAEAERAALPRQWRHAGRGDRPALCGGAGRRRSLRPARRSASGSGSPEG